MFQSTYLYKVRHICSRDEIAKKCFNPRTYIRYDTCQLRLYYQEGFQSTYLYKVRHTLGIIIFLILLFQSTYLYKVRLRVAFTILTPVWFQSTYLYKVRQHSLNPLIAVSSFNPRTYIRYDSGHIHTKDVDIRFNPRTYIRYDCITNNANIYSLLSMHLCDNKLFGFFIDEIKLIGVFNRLIINDCENSSFLLMLNVRKQLYYKFIFYIIGCDDTYVFNSFRIIISQEIETNTIFFMIDDIR